MTAVGIHDHERLKLGLKRTDPAKPILSVDQVLTGITPPVAEDRYSGVTFGLDGNDSHGTCGPTAVDNDRRSTSKVATGSQRTATIEEVYGLYRQSGNPNFDPNDPNTEDNGVEMGGMLDALLANGLGGDKPVAFARAKDTSDEAIERLVAVFGGVLFVVELEEAQQSQSDGPSPQWVYKKSGLWGGHAIYCGKYKVLAAGNVDAPVISWAKEIGTDDSFRSHQLQEVWVVIWPWHLEHPAFLEGVDLDKLAGAYKELTGKVLPLPTPAPTPGPEVSAADLRLWEAVKHWTEARHVDGNRRAAESVRAWAAAKGLI